MYLIFLKSNILRRYEFLWLRLLLIMIIIFINIGLIFIIIE